MEVLVLLDFEGTMGDEITVRTGDVVKNVTKATEDGWLEGEVRGKRGIFPANFVKEVPVFLMGDHERVPRSIRTTKRKKVRTCEVVYPYQPMNEDELPLFIGEKVEIISEIEDGWWMGMKNGRVGAFPANFVREIFVVPKDGKHNDSKTRPKLSDAIFKIEKRATVRNKAKNVVECCQAMFDYKAKAEDELDFKKGDVVVLLRKETEDEGWWEGELNGRRGFFPDNFVMVIPPKDSLKAGDKSLPPARNINKEVSVKKESPAMDKVVPVKPKEEKPELKDLRSNPPTKVKLPSINKNSPAQLKDKTNRALSKTNGDASPQSAKSPEVKNGDHFDGVEVDNDKLKHPTANRAKPPQRRPPTGVAVGGQTPSEPEPLSPKAQTDKLPVLQKSAENLKPPPAKLDQLPKTPPPVRPAPPRIASPEAVNVTPRNEVTLQSLQAEIKELQTGLELLRTRYEKDIQEVKDELQHERDKRMTLEEEVDILRLKQ